MSDPDEQFGKTIAGSRWFSQDPEIERRQMVPYQERWRCPKDGCAGEMRGNGGTWSTYPAGFHHTCTACGFTAALSGVVYPRTIYLPAESGASGPSEASAGNPATDEQP